ncbi:LTA synthase family protein [Vagococcus vulneris]|uniref:Sulfatase n=1 Tax=Vagococcus vulneris TaxID=1977869 RepID=A0A429ZTH9_9ENTE|nr:LTA synthase family protein [Vagococcus vulneris]RST96930.1 sulfatase [Vagococcus vulneris]
MIIQILIYSLIGIIFGMLNHYLFNQSKRSDMIIDIVKSFLLVNTLSLVFIRFVLAKKFILNAEHYVTIVSLKYIAVALSIGSLLTLLKWLLLKKTSLFQRSQTIRKRDILLTFISALLIVCGIFLFVGTNWFISYFGELTPEQFIFNFNSPIKGTSSDFYVSIFNGPILLLTGIYVLLLFFLFSPYQVVINGRVLLKTSVKQVIFLICSLFIFGGGIYYTIQRLQLTEVYQAYYSDSPYIKDNYVRPNHKILSFPEKKRNLVHIYLESYENSFYDKENGGYMTDNLMPDLMKLSQEGISFSENKEFGGPYQTYGSSWSVASMVNMSTGLPLKVPMDGNSYGKSGYFLPGAQAIGDILNAEGYNQTIMFGADADFGGLTSFFTNHKDFHIYDVKYAREIGKIPQNYNVWWGFEDKKLYEFAKEEMTRLDKEGKPFNFTMENADTHFPDGYIEEGTPTPYDSQYANVIAHSQKEAVKLVRWIMDQSFYENTTVVLTGDHLSMDKNFFKGWDKNYHRTTTNLILNGDFNNRNIQIKERDFAPFDMYPTVLSAMGVKIEGNRLGLGTDLSSNQKTLIERDGLKKVNDELSKNSHFYNNEFVSEKNK